MLFSTIADPTVDQVQHIVRHNLRCVVVAPGLGRVGAKHFVESAARGIAWLNDVDARQLHRGLAHHGGITQPWGQIQAGTSEVAATMAVDASGVEHLLLDDVEHAHIA